MTSEFKLQDTILNELIQILSQDSRVRALWVKGSLGRMRGSDRHSDIDLHILLNASHIKAFSKDLPRLLVEVRPLLHLHPLFDGHMVVTLLQGAPKKIVALDLFLGTNEKVELDEMNHRILFNPVGAIERITVKPYALVDLQRELEVQIRFFWRIFAMFPSIERGELIQAMKRLTDGVEVALQICSLGRGRFRDIGENRGNELLLPEERQELESVLAIPGLSISSMAKKQLKLADFVARRGRNATESLKISYPEQLEQAVLEYVHAELQRMGLDNLSLEP